MAGVLFLEQYLTMMVSEWENNMPEIVVYAAEGRTAEQKKKLLKKITEAVVDSLDVGAEHVIVSIVETKKSNKSRGGVPFDEL